MTLFELNDVTFHSVFSATTQIAAGRTTLIRGRSGTGKSTLLKMLNRMISPTSGHIRYSGTDLCELSPVAVRREVVMLPQQPVLFGGTVREEVLAGRRYAEMPPVPDDDLQTALTAAQLDVALDASPTNFSGGEKQRLCLARVLAMEPPVLLLDEPTVGLDRETEAAVFSCIRDQQAAGRSIIAASHSSFTSMLGDVDELVFSGGHLRPAGDPQGDSQGNSDE
ncbi:MAG: ABC transporter ATP-binding protein [Alkalispirochaeta sp.]